MRLEYKAIVGGVSGDSSCYAVGVGPHNGSARVEAEGSGVRVELEGIPLGDQPRIGDVLKVSVEFLEEGAS